MWLGDQEIIGMRTWAINQLLNERDMDNIRRFQDHYDPECVKHEIVIAFLTSKGGICNWTDPDLTEDLLKKISNAIEDGMLQSFCETETYMLME
jgi:hypothetical protein